MGSCETGKVRPVGPGHRVRATFEGPRKLILCGALHLWWIPTLGRSHSALPGQIGPAHSHCAGPLALGSRRPDRMRPPGSRSVFRSRGVCPGPTRRAGPMPPVCQGSAVPAFRFLCPLRWSDTDAYGHVNNVELMRLLEEARVALFFTRAAAPASRRSTGTSWSPGTRSTSPRRCSGGPSRCGSTPTSPASAVPRSRWATRSANPSGPRQVYVRATTVMVTFDPELGRTRRLSEAERELPGGHADPATPGPSGASDEQPGAAVGGQGPG